MEDEFLQFNIQNVGEGPAGVYFRLEWTDNGKLNIQKNSNIDELAVDYPFTPEYGGGSYTLTDVREDTNPEFANLLESGDKVKISLDKNSEIPGVFKNSAKAKSFSIEEDLSEAEAVNTEISSILNIEMYYEYKKLLTTSKWEIKFSDIDAAIKQETVFTGKYSEVTYSIGTAEEKSLNNV
jgi:hypothetical protein